MKKAKSRFEDSIGYLFATDCISNSEKQNVNFICSSSDVGVRRNGGRAGSKFGPQSILNQFKKLNNHLAVGRCMQNEVSSQTDEKINFSHAQENEAQKIINIINTNDKIIHLGGGHDHAFPMLRAIEHFSDYDKILILNLDAHCDTRIEDISHSGTPFRDFDKISQKKFFLLQIGIHLFANSSATLTPLQKGKMHIEAMDSIKAFSSIKFESTIKENCPFQIDEKTIVFLSLDCDALHSSVMQAVSAVNHNGLQLDYVENIISYLKAKNLKTIFGIYEYNPLFDNLASSSARSIAYLIEKFLS